jgi:hypothetical protein
MAIGFIDAGGKTLTKAKMKDLREALTEVVNTWEQPGSYEEVKCSICSGNGWFRRQLPSMDASSHGSLAFEEVACELCGGSGVLYRVSYRLAGDRSYSKGAQALVNKGIARRCIRWG